MGSSALLARDRDNQLFLGLGRRRVWAKTARKTFNRLNSGDGRDYLVDGSCSQWRQLEKACRTSRTLLASARTCAHTTSERLSARGSLAEPGLHRRRRERVPRKLLPRCSRSGTPVELFLEVLLPCSRSHCLASNGQISLLEKFPTDELYRRRLQRGKIPLPRSIRTLVVLEQVPTRSRTRLAVLASKILIIFFVSTYENHFRTVRRTVNGLGDSFFGFNYLKEGCSLFN